MWAVHDGGRGVAAATKGDMMMTMMTMMMFGRHDG